MTRWLFLTHRYLGIATCVLMVAWCVSGVVMMYVSYPSLAHVERLAHLQPVDWNHCCKVGDASIPADRPIERFEVEMAAGRPLLRLKPTVGPESLVDLRDGQPVAAVSAAEAAQIAADFAKMSGCSCSAHLLRVSEYDQWTVAGDFNPARPLFLFALNDGAQTQLYVSSRDGRIVQVTTEQQRFWNWLGAIPHWMYFVSLRHNPSVWNQVVIWTSVAGSLLTLMGLYIGIRQLVQAPRGRWSPYRGLSFWHHLPGVVFGVFLLTWVVSGLLSMNPWGLLESRGEANPLRGKPITAAQVKVALSYLGNLANLPGIVSIESVPLAGRLFLVVTTQQGARWRFDGHARSARLSDADWRQITRTLGGEVSREPQVLLEGDAYYFDRHDREALLPAYRIIDQRSQHTRYYLDPLTGKVLATFDADARRYRWLHQGLHTIDMTATLRQRPVRDVLMIVLLMGAGSICVTGTVMALRRLLRTVPASTAVIHE